jgi:hypothetical protein
MKERILKRSGDVMMLNERCGEDGMCAGGE